MRHVVVVSILWLIAVGLLCAWGTQSQAGSHRLGDPKQTVIIEPAPDDYEQIELSWAMSVDPVAVASPERTDMAGNMLANLLSDPSWRIQVQKLFEHWLAIGYEKEIASAMAKEHAALIALAFADALLEAAGG